MRQAANRNKKPGRGPKFVAIPKEMLYSRAYQDLPASAAKALPYFLWKIGVKTKSALDDPTRFITPVDFTYKEAEGLGFRRSTFSNVLKAWVGYGFVDPVSKGGLRGFGHTSSLFRLSQRWIHWGTVAFTHVRWEEFRNDSG